MTFAAIVLAAGSATRFGGGKLATLLDGEPLLTHAIRAARAAPVARVVVVAPPALDIGAWPGSPPVDRVLIESDAMSTSLKAGVAAVGAVDGAFVFLGDMPLVPRDLAALMPPLLAARYAVVPHHDDKPGHPVLLSYAALADVALLDGDRGAGALLRNRSDVLRMDFGDPGILIDIDTREDLARLERRAD